MSNSTWTDNQQRAWSAAVNVNGIRRAKELVGVNLIEAADGQLFGQLASDPVLLVNTLYAVCKPQADERGVGEEEFGALLVGDTIEEAAKALAQGIIDFFPSENREVLSRLWNATTRTRNEAIKLAASKMDPTRIDQAINAILQKTSSEIDARFESLMNEYGTSSGNSQDTSALTPVP